MKQKQLNPNCGPFSGVGVVWSDDRTEVYAGNCKEITSQQFATQSHPSNVKFDFVGDCCEYLYFISWSNDSGENGLLVELQGDGKIYSGHPDWEVFATGINKNVGSGAGNAVTIAEINQQLERACKVGWKKPFVGQKNNGAGQPFGTKPGISTAANFMWHDSGKDPNNLFPVSPYVPFDGFNHDEFLIFRIPFKSIFPKRCVECECEKCDCGCGCGCDGCNENADAQDQELIQRADDKFNTVPHSTSCPPQPLKGMECEKVLGTNVNLAPCIYLHWGDSNTDTIENHDTEIVYITVCNPFDDVEFKGFRITKINLVPNPTQVDQARIVPDRFINYDCLPPCSCKTREFTFITRDQLNQYIGTKSLEIEYCWDEITIKKNNSYGVATIPINIVQDA